MANFAALIAPLSISGSRKSDGTANASGTAWFFQPGGNTPVAVYKDAEASAVVTQPVTLTNGGLLNRSSFPDGIFATQPIRILIQDSNGSTVSDTVYIPATSGNVGVDNEGWSGSTLDEALTALFTSLGGVDGQYLIANGQTNRPYNEVITELSISVKAFGAVGDGVNIDTTAIQAALNFAKAAGGGIVYFPPGTYKIDQALTLTSANGVSIVGTGTFATKIITTHTSANVFTLSSCTSTVFEGLGISASATNSGSAISLSGCTGTELRNILVNTTGGGTFLIPVITASSTATLILTDCVLTAKSADASARALKMTDTTTVYIRGGTYSGFTGAAMEFAGATSKVSVIGSAFGNVNANVGILFTSGLTGTDFTVVGCPTLRSAAGTVTTPFDLSAITTNPRFRQWGNEVDGYTAAVTSGGTFTPDLSRGRHIRMQVTTTGAAITIAAPIPAPSTLMYDVTMMLDVFNNAGGAISHAYTLNAVYKLATVPNQTDTNHNQYLLVWDPNSSVWRQVALSVTT